MKHMLRGVFVLVAVIGVGSSFFNLRCIACQNDVTEADYVRMASEIVEQSVQK